MPREFYTLPDTNDIATLRFEMNRIFDSISRRLNFITDDGDNTSITDKKITNLGEGSSTTDAAQIEQSLGDMVLGSTNAVYFGVEDVDGSWRIIRSGNKFNIERREANVWTKKGAFRAS